MLKETVIPDLAFHAVTVADLERYADVAKAEGSLSADHSFVNLYVWNNTYHQELAFFEDRAVVRFGTDNAYRYLFPIGSGDPSPVLNALLKAEPKLHLAAVTEQELDCILQHFPDTFSVFEERDLADYLYSATSLATLSGKKLHGKRNHINAFSAANNWHVLPLTEAHFPACREILKAWQKLHQDVGAQNENDAIELAFESFSALSLHGALLVANDKPVAFTIGSMLTPTALCVHFEKALPDVQGAYPTVNREFVRMMLERFPDLTTVNREDDMGLENLRAAKLSYRPTALLRKFTLIEK